jgi:PKD repeat protein
VLTVISFTVLPSLGAPSFTQHTIGSNYTGPWSVYAVDLDGDEDIDVVSSAGPANRVDWWENDGNQGFTLRAVSNALVYPMAVCAADFDADGDVDVVCAANLSGEVAWFENDGGQNFTKHGVGDWPGASYVWADDVNGDGHTDILAAACEGGGGLFGWFENDGSGGFAEHLLLDNWEHANRIHAADVESDGDVDLLGSASWAGDIWWFENDGDENFTPHSILDTSAHPSSVHGVDLDGDGDTDVLATVCVIDQIIWFENDGNEQFIERTIATGFLRPRCVWPADLDGDEDIDLVGAAFNSNEISWWENDGAQVFTKHTLSGGFAGASDAYVEDVDRDGDPDVLGAAQVGNQLAWWENDLYGFRFAGDPTSGHAPLTVQFRDLSAADPPLTYRAWDFDSDGVVDSEDVAPTWTYLIPGYYAVTLEVGNDSVAETIVYEDFVRVFDGESAVEFDGASGHAVCTATPALNLTDRLTLEAWIKPAGWGEAGSPGCGRIVDKSQFALYLNGSGSPYNDHSLLFLLKNASGPPVISCSPVGSIILDEWQHVAATYSASTGEVALFINGQECDLTQTGTPSGYIRDNAAIDLFIGSSSSGMNTFCGVIDEARIWGGSRSGGEIRAAMGDTLSGSEPGLVALWRMNSGSGTVLEDASPFGHDATLEATRWAQGIDLALSGEDHPHNDRVPASLELRTPYPNPFVKNTTLLFQLSRSAHGRVAIYDVHGKLVSVLADGLFTDGPHAIQWDGTNGVGVPLASGVYFCRLECASRSTSRPLVLTR